MRTGIPVVNVSGTMAHPRLPTVIPDDVAVGQAAARHLIDRGFKKFAFCSSSELALDFCARRHDGFRQAVEAAGGACWVHVPKAASAHDSWEADQAELARWLSGLQKPVGILAFADSRAVSIAQACRRAGLSIPEDVALIGVDNDELHCLTCMPPLSSVNAGAAKIGFEAAALLDRLMAGHAPPREPIRIRPAGVVTRRSTDILAVDDRDVAQSLDYIRQHGHLPIGLKQLLADVPVARRSLHRKFQRVLGKSVAQVIRETHLELARAMLATTNRSTAEVAQACGFKTSRHFRICFQKAMGVTPMVFRKASRQAKRAPAANV